MKSGQNLSNRCILCVLKLRAITIFIECQKYKTFQFTLNSVWIISRNIARIIVKIKCANFFGTKFMCNLCKLHISISRPVGQKFFLITRILHTPATTMHLSKRIIHRIYLYHLFFTKCLFQFYFKDINFKLSQKLIQPRSQEIYLS